jgi:L-fucose dehydrogenase
MNLDLLDKVVIVTGGAKGIGEGIVRVLADEGAVPVIVGRNEKDNQRLLTDINSLQPKSICLTAELSKPAECSKVIETTIAHFGFINGLVNNAGINDGVGLENGSYEKFVTSLHRNLIHYYMMAHYALPYLQKSSGSIVNIGSKTAETGQGNTSAYAASNGGRNALTREWAVELLPKNIRVNAVIVAECYTPLYENWIKTFPDPVAKLRSICDKIPLGKRMTATKEIGDMVAFLLSNRSSHTTGQLVHVDGGYVHLDRAIE